MIKVSWLSFIFVVVNFVSSDIKSKYCTVLHTLVNLKPAIQASDDDQRYPNCLLQLLIESSKHWSPGFRSQLLLDHQKRRTCRLRLVSGHLHGRWPRLVLIWGFALCRGSPHSRFVVNFHCHWNLSISLVVLDLYFDCSCSQMPERIVEDVHDHLHESLRVKEQFAGKVFGKEHVHGYVLC